MSRTSATRTHARNAWAVTLLWGLIGLSVAGCGKAGSEASAEDVKHLQTRMRMLVEDLPLERLVTNLEMFESLVKEKPELAGARHLSTSEVDSILAEWSRGKKALNAAPWWGGDGALSPEQRAAEVARMAEMKRSRDAILEILRPHRAWVESRYGTEIFSATK